MITCSYFLMFLEPKCDLLRLRSVRWNKPIQLCLSDIGKQSLELNPEIMTDHKTCFLIQIKPYHISCNKFNNGGGK